MAKAFVTERLACFTSPTAVQMELRERFRIEASLPTILYYDATASGTDLAEKWRQLFARTRQRYTESVADVPIAHQRVRLERLERDERQLLALADKADRRGAFALAGELVEKAARIKAQAAKECGGMYQQSKLLGLSAESGAFMAEEAARYGVALEDVDAAVGAYLNELRSRSRRATLKVAR